MGGHMHGWIGWELGSREREMERLGLRREKDGKA